MLWMMLMVNDGNLFTISRQQYQTQILLKIETKERVLGVLVLEIKFCKTLYIK